jgi:MFS family permease
MKRTSLLVFPLLSALFCFSMFYRVTNAVIALDLVRDFNLDAERLGMLGSAFFYAFALFQIPIGILLDRTEPRRVIFFFTLVGAAGAFVFACAGSYFTAFIGRVLLGVGMASVLMGSFKVFIMMHPPQRFAILSGTISAIGTLGAILATSPLAYLNATIGWRLTLFSCGVITAVLAVLIFWVLQEENYEKRDGIPSAVLPEQKKGVIQSAGIIVRTLAFWQLSALSFCRYGTFVALQGVWFGPYLMSIKGYAPVAAGNILTMLSVGQVIGAPIAGYLASRVFRTSKPVLMFGTIFYALSLFPLMGIWKIESAAAFSALFFCLGFFNGFGMLAYTHIKELFPISMSGTAITGVNFFLMGGGAFFMQIIGVIISLYAGTPQAGSAGSYRLVFFVCMIGMFTSIIFYAFSKSKR